MLSQDRWPELVDGTYSRAAVQRFLDEAEAARERVEALLDVAHQRRRILHGELAEVAARQAALQRELEHTTREIHTDRQSQASAVAAVLAAAEADAEAILARARAEAAAIRSGALAGAPSPNPRLALVTSSSDGPASNEPPLLVS